MAVAGAASGLRRFIRHDRTHNPLVNSVNRQILAHLEADRLSKAVNVLSAFPEPVSYSLYERLFRLCSAKYAIVEARKVECHLVTFSPVPPVFLLNRAIEAFGKCGCIDDAQELFEQMHERDGGSWNAVITACAHNGVADEVFRNFRRMNREGIRAKENTFASLLRSCGFILDLSTLKQLHGAIIKNGFLGNVILETAMVDVYGKCSVITDARRLFDEIKNPSDVSWNVIVRRHLEMGNDKEAVIMFSKMLEQNVRPLNHTVSSAIVACSSSLALEVGMEIHAVAIKINFEADEVVSTSLIDMYVKCGKLNSGRRIFDQTESKDLISWTSSLSGYAMGGTTREARELFDEMPERNVVSWNAMLGGYVRALEWDKALDFLAFMLMEAVDIDHVTIALILNVCSGLSDVEMGKKVHAIIFRFGYEYNILVANALLDMYGKCRNLRSANIWFHRMGKLRDGISWNALLTSYAQLGRSEQAILIFKGMQLEAKPSKLTFGTLLASCANIQALKLGKEIHGYMIRNGYVTDVVILGAMVDMYCKCRCLYYALLVFKETAIRDLALWNSIILGCCHNGRSKEVFELIIVMEDEGIKPDHATFQGILLACIHSGNVELGKQYFNSMSTRYNIMPRVEHYNCMVELYCKYGCMDELEEFLTQMPFDPTIQMLTRISDACGKHGFSRLGTWATERLNELSP